MAEIYTGDTITPGFGWKRIYGSYEGNDEDYRVLKRIIHDYPNLKWYRRKFEKDYKFLIDLAELEGADVTFVNSERLNELLALPIAEVDKKKLYAYFRANTKVMVLEIGMESLPEGLYREVAYDKYFGRMTYQQIMEKYDVNHKRVQRALKKARQLLAKYARWYLDLAKEICWPTR